jgi:hypothetical protein
MELVIGALIAAFVLALIVGTIVRAARAPSGQRMRAAFGPMMSAGETYQQLHTGQKGLHDSVIESIQQQEAQPSRTDGDER